jgi:hypothetical protein
LAVDVEDLVAVVVPVPEGWVEVEGIVDVVILGEDMGDVTVLVIEPEGGKEVERVPTVIVDNTVVDWFPGR